MEKISTVDELINLIVQQKKNELKLYSSSAHRKYAEKIINKVVNDNNEYYDIANCFCLYPLQNWCSKKRKELQIDIDALEDAIRSNDKYFGIKTHQNLEIQKNTLVITNKIIKKIGYIIESETRSGLTISECRAIRDVFCGEASSKYIVCNYFESGIEKLFYLFNDEFAPLCNEREEIFDNIDDDFYLVFHNIDDLLYITRNAKDDRSFKWNDVDFMAVKKVLSNSINMLDEYPFMNDLKTIAYYRFNGNNESNTASLINKSRTYVESRYKEVQIVLECLIWGLV